MYSEYVGSSRVDSILKEFPLSYQFDTLSIDDPLLREYMLYPIGKIMEMMRSFINKKPCGFAHERIPPTPIVYPEGVNEEDFMESVFDRASGKDSPLLAKIMLFNHARTFNSDTCTHKKSNVNCGHPELTGLAQLIVISVAWLIENGILLDIKDAFERINLVTGHDASFSQSFGGSSLDEVKIRQKHMGDSLLVLIEDIRTRVEQAQE